MVPRFEDFFFPCLLCLSDGNIYTQELLRTYVIDYFKLTPEEAKVSRQKNVITRAMQPLLERRPCADIRHITDIRPGDCFLMCTDGILENMEDEDIRHIFSDASGDIQQKTELIINATAGNKDNHSAFIIHIEKVKDAGKSRWWNIFGL